MNTQNIFKLTALAAALLLAIMSSSMSSVQARISSVVSVTSPKSVYNQNCSICHGADGRSDTPKGRETDADDLTTGGVKGMGSAKMTRIIKNGKGDMPGFGKKLTAAQIAQVIGYVKSL